jgi:hypothetical protein
MELKTLLLWLCSTGAGVVAFWVMERLAWFSVLAPESKRIWSIVLTALVAILAWSCQMAGGVGRVAGVGGRRCLHGQPDRPRGEVFESREQGRTGRVRRGAQGRGRQGPPLFCYSTCFQALRWMISLMALSFTP